MSGGAAAGGFFEALGSMIEAQSADDASARQAQAAREAQETAKNQWIQTRMDQGPYRQAGYDALAQLQYLLGIRPGSSATATSEGLPETAKQTRAGKGFSDFGNYLAMIDQGTPSDQAWAKIRGLDMGMQGGVPSTFTPTGQFGELSQKFGADQFKEDPGYQFRMDQARKALERSAAARGNLLSGGTIKGIQDYSQGLASQEYQNAYNRFQNDQTTRFNRLASLAGIGQTATKITGQLGADAASRMGEYSTQIGNAGAAGSLGRGSAWSSGLRGLGEAAQNYADWRSMQDDEEEPKVSTNYEWD